MNSELIPDRALRIARLEVLAFDLLERRLLAGDLDCLKLFYSVKGRLSRAPRPKKAHPNHKGTKPRSRSWCQGQWPWTRSEQQPVRGQEGAASRSVAANQEWRARRDPGGAGSLTLPRSVPPARRLQGVRDRSGAGALPLPAGLSSGLA